MKLRHVILALAVAAMAGAGWIGWRFAHTTAAHGGPIVLISIDTLRADHLPAYGYRKVATPAIDALAADGLLFEQSWSHSPLTLPSHVSILTGLLPFQHGVRDNLGFAVRTGEHTLARMLAERGFATGGFVSAYVMRKDTGIGQGFDTYDDRLPPSSPEIAIGEVQRDGADTVEAAEAWLDRLRSSRFFLFLHLYEPHTPYAPPERFKQYLPYDGEIAYADELVGRVIASLRNRGLYDDALIILLSDHGEGLGGHGEQEHGVFLYRETTHVPLIIKLPGGDRAGRRVATPVQHADLVPTILDKVRAPHPAGLRGRSLVPIFTGGTIAEAGLYAEALYSRYHFGWSELYALTDARYRFIRAPRDELYDIQEDAGEQRNVAADRESTRIAMRQALEKLMAGAKIDAPAEVSAEDRERLKALGYIGMQATVNPESGADALPDPKERAYVLTQYRTALDMVRGGRMSEAIRVFQSIVAENPGMADVWSELAGLLVRQGRLEEAVAVYKRLVETAPHEPAAIVSVVQVLVELGRNKEARQQAELALKMLPAAEARWRATTHKLLMRMALAENDLDTARAEAARGEEADPAMPLRDFTEGLIHFNAGRFAEAVPCFQSALKKSADRTFQIPDLRYYLGDSLARIERQAEAEQQLTDEVRLFPSSTRARSGLAMLYRVQGRIEESNRAIETMLRVSPTPDAFALAEKLWTMFGEGRRAAAVRAERAKMAKAAPAAADRR